MKERYPTHAFSVFALCALAISVNMGVALVSISKVLILLAFIAKLFFLVKDNKLSFKTDLLPSGVIILLCVMWMALSWLWSEAITSEKSANLTRHMRLLIFPVAYFLLETKQDALKVLFYLIGTQLFVVCCSWLLWLGIPIPWATPDYSASLGIVFMSTLEQPIVSTIALVIIWFLRFQIPIKWPSIFVKLCLFLIITNVFFVMSGRSGYLTLILALSFILFFEIKIKYKLIAMIVPLIMVATLFVASDRFSTRMLQIKNDIIHYKNGNINTSQGLRLDYWSKSIEAIQEKPILGHGVGSWAPVYHRLKGFDETANGNPHQQFLLWFVEAGLIGFTLLLYFFLAAYKDGIKLEKSERQALIVLLAIIILISLMNSPFYGAGIGEFLLLTIAALLGLGKFSRIP